MTKKRLLLIGGFLAACVCLPLGIAALLPPTPGVTKANFDRVQEGMTMPEVRAILGEDSIPRLSIGDDARTFNDRWIADDGSEARILFDCVVGQEEEGYVVSSMVWHESSETPFQKICRWLRLR